MAFKAYLKSLCEVPTAAYCEEWIMEIVEDALAKIPGLTVKKDKFGNISARLKRGDMKNSPPIAWVAHMDHPCFVVHKIEGGGRDIHATFEGGVNDEFFRTREVRLFRGRDDAGIKARVEEVGERIKGKGHRVCRLQAEEDASGAILGMWDLTPYKEEGSLIHSRAIDDLGGCAILLETLNRLSKLEEPTDTIALFTRAEEIGFRGAIALCMEEDRDDYLPNNAWVFSVETSSARPSTPIGGGAVIRVGDKSTIFHPEMTLAMMQVSKKLAENGGRPLQRALMDGGSCEASAFNAFGYLSGGVCLPLGNYHNMDQEKGVIAEEFINEQDAEDLVKATVALGLMQNLESGKLTADLRKVYEELGNDARDRLISSA